MRKAASGRWTSGTQDAESMLAEARKALFVMVGFIAILWIVQVANVADHYALVRDYGITPRSPASLPDILTAPFLHFSWTHLEGNSGPLFIFGFLAAYRGVYRFLGLTVLIIVISGMAAWLTAPANSLGAGASGVVFGYLGYILIRGLVDRHVIDIVIGAVLALCFAYQFSVLLPHAGIGWQDHIGGLVAGLLGGWVFRERRAARPAQVRTAQRGKAAGTAAAGTAVQPTASTPAATPYTGPRADLHKELDDLGI